MIRTSIRMRRINMDYTIAERFDLHTRIMEQIILNPGLLPDMIFPNHKHKMHFRPISAIRNTGFIVSETYDDDERRELFVEIDIQNPGGVNIKYSILINKSDKSGQQELFNIAKAKISSYHDIIEDVIMNDYRDKHITYGELEKIKVQIQDVTTMLLLYAYQVRMQYGLKLIPEEIDDITFINNFDEKPSESEENDEELSEKAYDKLKTELSSYVQKQCFAYKSNITDEVANLLEGAENKVKDEVSDIFHDRLVKLETANEKMSDSIESINCDMARFKSQMAEYTQKMFNAREEQMIEKIIEKLKTPVVEEKEVKPYNPIADAIPVYGCPAAVPTSINLSSKQPSFDEETALKEFANTLKELSGNVDPKICIKVVKDRTKEPEVDESVVFKCNCKDIFAKLARITREMATKASSTCHESGQLSFRDTINMRGDIDREEFKKILNSPFCRGSYHGNQLQKRFLEEGAVNTYHISCVIDSFLSGAVLFKFNIRDNLIYPKGADINFNFNDNHDLCVVDNTLWDFDEIKSNILFRYMITGNRGDGFVVRELLNICSELKKRKEEVEKDGK